MAYSDLSSKLKFVQREDITEKYRRRQFLYQVGAGLGIPGSNTTVLGSGTSASYVLLMGKSNQNRKLGIALRKWAYAMLRFNPRSGKDGKKCKVKRSSRESMRE